MSSTQNVVIQKPETVLENSRKVTKNLRWSTSCLLPTFHWPWLALQSTQISESPEYLKKKPQNKTTVSEAHSLPKTISNLQPGLRITKTDMKGPLETRPTNLHLQMGKLRPTEGKWPVQSHTAVIWKTLDQSLGPLAPTQHEGSSDLLLKKRLFQLKSKVILDSCELATFPPRYPYQLRVFRKRWPSLPGGHCPELHKESDHRRSPCSLCSFGRNSPFQPQKELPFQPQRTWLLER